MKRLSPWEYLTSSTHCLISNISMFFPASPRVSMAFRCDFWEMREPSLVLHTSRSTNLYNAYRSITDVLHPLFYYSTLPDSNSTSNSSSNFSCSFLITSSFSFRSLAKSLVPFSASVISFVVPSARASINSELFS